jgi:DNA polymerase III subunit delta
VAATSSRSATGTSRGPVRSTGARSSASARGVPPDQLRPAPVVLVVGGEDLLAERAVAAVVGAARAEDPELVVENLEAAGYESGRLLLLASPSLFGGGMVIVANGVETANDAFVTDATAYLKAPAPDVCVVLRHSGGPRARPLLEAARAAGAPEAACQPISRDEEKVDFVTAEFRRLGRKASPQAVRALVDAVGSDLRELASACSQLAEDAEGTGRVEVAEVELRFGGRVEVTGFRVADAAVAGQAEQALALLRHALATGADPVPLVAALAAKVRALAKVSVAGRGKSADLAAALGMAPWQVDRARRELTGWREAGLAEAVLALAEADAAVKGGGRDPVYAVEKAVLTIAAARG